jgi:hypothetical protein
MYKRVFVLRVIPFRLSVYSTQIFRIFSLTEGFASLEYHTANGGPSNFETDSTKRRQIFPSEYQ